MARVLVERAQSRSQQHRITFDSPVDVISVVKDIASLMQVTTQSGGYRPFGVAMLIAGVDKDGIKLYATDPVGVYYQYNATAIGEKGDEAIEILKAKWNTNLTVEKGIELALSILKEVLGDTSLSTERIDCAYVDANMQMHKLNEKEIGGPPQEMSRGGPTFDHERISVNLARLRKGGENFEIVIDPDKAVAFKQGEEKDLAEVLMAEKIFFDAKKGELASETHMETVFGTRDPKEIAQRILDEGEIQLTSEHRDRIQEAKRKKIIQMIHMNAINPGSGLVHPEERIRLAF